MKKVKFMASTFLVLFLFVVVLTGVAPSVVSAHQAKAPVVSVIIANNANTTFDNELTQKVNERITTKLAATYRSVPGEIVAAKLAAAGIGDPAMTSARDVANVVRESGVDYVVYVRIDPFVRKERWSAFTHNMNMIAVVPYKIIDVKAGTFLYAGRSVESVTHDTFVMLGLGNKPTCLAALDKALDKVELTAYRVLPLK